LALRVNTVGWGSAGCMGGKKIPGVRNDGKPDAFISNSLADVTKWLEQEIIASRRGLALAHAELRYMSRYEMRDRGAAHPERSRSRIEQVGTTRNQQRSERHLSTNATLGGAVAVMAIGRLIFMTAERQCRPCGGAGLRPTKIARHLEYVEAIGSAHCRIVSLNASRNLSRSTSTKRGARVCFRSIRMQGNTDAGAFTRNKKSWFGLVPRDSDPV